MFSPEIVCSEEFLSMPVSARALYYHLGMNADDDGFIQPQIAIRVTGASKDDLNVLLSKRFILPFESGVVVIKHWLIHNMIRGDRYKPTRFQEEKKALIIKENKAYTDRLPDWQPNGNQMAPQVRLGKVRLLGADAPIVIVSEDPDKPQRKDSRSKDKLAVYSLFSEKPQPWFNHKQQKEAALRLFDRGLDRLEAGLAIMRDNEDDQFCPKAHTPFEYEQKLPKLNAYKKKNGL